MKTFWDYLTGKTGLRAQLDVARHELMEAETQAIIDKNIIEVLLWEKKHGKSFDPGNSGTPAVQSAWYDDVHGLVV